MREPLDAARRDGLGWRWSCSIDVGYPRRERDRGSIGIGLTLPSMSEGSGRSVLLLQGTGRHDYTVSEYACQHGPMGEDKCR